jgi:hypothetical protein
VHQEWQRQDSSPSACEFLQMIFDETSLYFKHGILKIQGEVNLHVASVLPTHLKQGVGMALT